MVMCGTKIYVTLADHPSSLVSKDNDQLKYKFEGKIVLEIIEGASSLKVNEFPIYFECSLNGLSSVLPPLEKQVPNDTLASQKNRNALPPHSGYPLERIISKSPHPSDHLMYSNTNKSSRFLTYHGKVCKSCNNGKCCTFINLI